MEYATREELLACLEHLLATAGNPKLMTSELMHTLCDHGNYRVMSTLAAELLSAAAQHEASHLDEKLYLEVFTTPPLDLQTLAALKGPDKHSQVSTMHNDSFPLFPAATEALR